MTARPDCDLTFLHYPPGSVLAVPLEDVPGCYASGAGWCSDRCKEIALDAMRRAKIRDPGAPPIRAAQMRNAIAETLTNLARN